MATEVRAIGSSSFLPSTGGCSRSTAGATIRSSRPVKAANPTPAGARSRSPAVRLLARLGGFATDVLRFAYDLRVPSDKSQAERDIRMVKFPQKVSGGLRTMTGGQIFCAIRSDLSTADKRGLNALTVLIELHNGQAWLP